MSGAGGRGEAGVIAAVILRRGVLHLGGGSGLERWRGWCVLAWTWCSNGRKAGALGGRVASVGVHHVVGLTKSGSGKCRLAGEALQAVAFRYAMITVAVAVGLWVELGRSGGLTGGCGSHHLIVILSSDNNHSDVHIHLKKVIF